MQTLRRIACPTPNLTRRTFLTTATSAALVPATGLAATIKIAIVGAGLAGLTAAYQLSKAGYAFRIYEASSRLGGRCYSARDVFADGQVAEHGGEFFDTGHTEIIALAKELGLTLDDVLATTPKDTHSIYISAGKPYTLAQATKDWQPLYPVLQAQAKAIGEPNWRHATPTAKKFDAMTITDWIAAYVPGGASGQLGELIATAFAEENAADSDEQSALNVIGTLVEDPRDKFNLYYTDSDQRFHTRGGNDQIPTRLGENLAANIHTGAKLTAIRRVPNGKIRLTFDGAPEESFDRVIIAIPFAVIREAVDIDHAGFRPMKRQAIANLPIGASVKCQLQFTNRAWTPLGCTGETRLPSKYFQTTWEVTRAQPGTLGIINFFSGGSRARAAGALDNQALAAACLHDFEAVIPGISALWNGRMTNDAWHKNPLSRGSYTFYPPGYQTTLLGIESEPEGNCFFAGEHTAPEPGFMNAGVVSGQRAARQLAGATRR
jgi:monoamine oxidase